MLKYYRKSETFEVSNMAEFFENDMCFRTFFNAEKNKSEARLHCYLGNQSVVKIPEFVNMYRVTVIGQWAFEKSSIEELYYPDSLCCIEDGAFIDCHNLKKVASYPTVCEPKSLDVMHVAFNRCENLTTFESYVPVNIWYQAFQGCSSLSQIDAKILGFGDKAFFDSKITSLHFADNVLWGKGSYSGMPLLTDLYFDGKISDDTCISYIKYIRRKRLHVNANKFNYMELAYDGTEILT